MKVVHEGWSMDPVQVVVHGLGWGSVLCIYTHLQLPYNFNRYNFHLPYPFRNFRHLGIFTNFTSPKEMLVFS